MQIDDECHVCGVHYDLVECPYHSELNYRSVPCCATCAENCKQDI